MRQAHPVQERSLLIHWPYTRVFVLTSQKVEQIIIQKEHAPLHL